MGTEGENGWGANEFSCNFCSVDKQLFLRRPRQQCGPRDARWYGSAAWAYFSRTEYNASKTALDSLSWCEVCAIVISFGENERPCTRIHDMQRNNAAGHATVTQRIVPVLAYEWLQLQPPLNPRGVINGSKLNLGKGR